MKQLILVTIITLTTINCFSQTPNFFIDGSVWTYNTEESYEPGMCTTNSILEKDSIQGDTLINGLIYKKLFITSQVTVQLYSPCSTGGGVQPATRIEKFLRYDTLSKKMFLLNDTSTLFTEQLINDFNLSAGDTLPISGQYASYGSNVIDSVNNIMFFGVPVRKYYLPDYDLGNYVIEGIGNSNGLTYFNPNWFPISGGMYLTTLLCFQSGDSIYDPSNSSCPQILSVGVSEVNKQVNNFSIFPNPFTSQTTVSFTEEQKNTTIKITDAVGKEIKIFDFSGRQLTIEKGNMQPGVYFLQIINSNKKCSFKKMVIR